MATKTAIEVPADPKWRHVVAATVLSAVRAGRSDPQTKTERANFDLADFDLGKLGDVSLLLERALDDIDQLAGVRRLLIEVETDRSSALITVIGEGDDIEPPAWQNPNASGSSDPLTGSSFVWTPTAVTCSIQIS